MTPAGLGYGKELLNATGDAVGCAVAAKTPKSTTFVQVGLTCPCGTSYLTW